MRRRLRAPESTLRRPAWAHLACFFITLRSQGAFISALRHVQERLAASMALRASGSGSGTGTGTGTGTPPPQLRRTHPSAHHPRASTAALRANFGSPVVFRLSKPNSNHTAVVLGPVAVSSPPLAVTAPCYAFQADQFGGAQSLAGRLPASSAPVW